LGVPFNIASYALLTLMIAQVTGLQPGDFVHTLGDAHIYRDHLEQCRLQVTREPYPLPRIELSAKVAELTQFSPDDVQLLDYRSHRPIRGTISV
jgi:thymidylate synthase